MHWKIQGSDEPPTQAFCQLPGLAAGAQAAAPGRRCPLRHTAKGSIGTGINCSGFQMLKYL